MSRLAEYLEERDRRYERAVRRTRAAALGWIREQNAEVMAQLGDEEIIQSELVMLGYDFRAAADELRATMREPLIIAAEEEAAAVYDWNANLFRRKGLFDTIEKTIEGMVDEVLGEPYWESVTEALKGWVQRWIDRATAKPAEMLGLTQTAAEATTATTSTVVSEQIKLTLPGVIEKVGVHRAEVIGETETSSILNGGGNAAGGQLAAIGEADIKTWLTMADERVRGSHRRLHMVSVPEDANFNVGGSPAPHPGWWQLPTEHRIACRCFLFHGEFDKREMDEIIGGLEPELKETIGASHSSGEPLA